MNLLISEGVSFTNNSADSGGALFLQSQSTLHAYGTLFQNNVALSNGGALMFREAGTIELINVQISGN